MDEMNEKDEWFPDVGEYLPENGIPPNPLDSMPIANGSNKYHPNGEPPDWEDTAPSEYEPPMTDSDWFINKPKDNYSSRHKSTPDHEKAAEEVVTMHEKMYRIATAKYNPFAVGGSETLGGSERFQGGSEQRFTPENDPYGGH